MKFPWTVLIAVVLFSAKVKAYNNPNESLATSLEESLSTEDVLAQRLSSIALPLEARYTTTVRDNIKRYVTNGYRDSEYMLGRTSMYFPIFEHYLRTYNLPLSLKYLPLIESSLRPRAKSPAGAAGLWQLVGTTAKSYGLVINQYVDERMDPHKSTQAAVKMLADLYEDFNDWGLALAAYNCGPGRVRSILRRLPKADSFWDIQHLLPRETKLYVPRFLAAAYLINFYQAHNLSPRYPEYDLQETRTFKVYNYLSLYKVAKACNISIDHIKKLNPAFHKGAIPQSKHGQYLVVPAKSVGAVRQHFADQLNLSAPPANRVRTHYTAVAGDNIKALALLFNCSQEDIMRWNGLQDPEIVVHQNLIIYLSTPRA